MSAVVPAPYKKKQQCIVFDRKQLVCWLMNDVNGYWCVGVYKYLIQSKNEAISLHRLSCVSVCAHSVPVTPEPDCARWSSTKMDYLTLLLLLAFSLLFFQQSFLASITSKFTETSLNKEHSDC